MGLWFFGGFGRTRKPVPAATPAAGVNWRDPSSRASYLDRAGPDDFEAERQRHRVRTIAETVNGHDIRPILEGRTIVYLIGEAEFPSLDAARKAAAGMEPGEPWI